MKYEYKIVRSDQNGVFDIHILNTFGLAGFKMMCMTTFQIILMKEHKGE